MCPGTTKDATLLMDDASRPQAFKPHTLEKPQVHFWVHFHYSAVLTLPGTIYTNIGGTLLGQHSVVSSPPGVTPTRRSGGQQSVSGCQMQSQHTGPANNAHQSTNKSEQPVAHKHFSHGTLQMSKLQDLIISVFPVCNPVPIFLPVTQILL